MGFPRALGAFSSRLADDRGVSLIETLISAVILVIVIGAVLTTIDASGRTTTVNKNRTVAATLAEADQERLRAMTPTMLATTPVAVQTVDGGGGTPYRVESRVDWIFDASGATESCQNDSGQANYLRITSTVTSGVVGTRVRPVTMRSIVAPRVDSFGVNAGTLTVKVTDQLGQPVPNMPVSISPAASLPRSTNEFGCAVFSHIPQQTYTATVDRAGWVNELRQQRYDKAGDVRKGETTNVSMTYAPAAAITVRFKTNGTPPLNSSAHALTLSNTRSGDITVLAPGTTPAATLTASSLFPYPDGYTAYSGRCDLNDPSAPAYPANADYFTSNLYPGFTNVVPGQGTTIDAHQPSVNVRIVDKDNKALTGARVIFTASGTGCGSTSGTAKFVRLTGSDGFLAADRGLPFGNYTACATLDATRSFGKSLGTIANTSPAGTTQTQYQVKTTDSATCTP